MKSVEARFKANSKEYIYNGNYINLARAVSGQNFTRPTLNKAFNNLVGKDDYLKVDRKKLINHLESLSRTSEELEKQYEDPELQLAMFGYDPVPVPNSPRQKR